MRSPELYTFLLNTFVWKLMCVRMCVSVRENITNLDIF